MSLSLEQSELPGHTLLMRMRKNVKNPKVKKKRLPAAFVPASAQRTKPGEKTYVYLGMKNRCVTVNCICECCTAEKEPSSNEVQGSKRSSSY